MQAVSAWALSSAVGGTVSEPMQSVFHLSCTDFPGFGWFLYTEGGP